MSVVCALAELSPLNAPIEVSYRASPVIRGSRTERGRWVEVSAHTRKLASALWEMSQKVSRVTEMQRGEVETLLKQRREESEVRGC